MAGATTQLQKIERGGNLFYCPYAALQGEKSKEVLSLYKQHKK